MSYSVRKTAKIRTSFTVAQVLPTIIDYTTAYNFVSALGFANKDHNSFSLHNKTYAKVRELVPQLNSQLVISARMKAANNLKAIRKNKYARCPISQQSSIQYDARSYSIKFNKQKQRIISIATNNGRIEAPLIIPTYYQELFANWTMRSADLVINKGVVYFHISFEDWVDEPILTGKTLGIDRGINNIAVSSDNKFYGTKQINRDLKRIIIKRKKQRQHLQKKGTKSAKRHLRQLSGKEKRFRADINHIVSKQIVASLNAGDTIVLENLTGIRRQKRRCKEQRFLLHNWSYYQLEEFIIYKAKAKGIRVVKIDPAYTSQMCSKCGYTEKANRKNSDFCCLKCEFRLHADLNGSRNIAVKTPYLAIC